jgi:hypothetical protein
MELEQNEHCQHPSDVGHSIQEVPVLVVEEVHVNGYQLHLEEHEEVNLLR